MSLFKERNMEGYELFKNSVSNMPMVFYVLDKNWMFKLSDGKGLEKLGLHPGQVVGMSAYELYKDHPDIIETIEKSYGGESTQAVHRLYDSWIENYVVPYYDSAGEIAGVIGATIDITERKNAEDELAKTRKFQEALINSVPGMLYMYNSEGKLVFWNKSHTTMTGYTDEELSQKNLMDWYADDPVSQKAVAEGLAGMDENGFGEAEANLHKKDRSILPMYFTACPLKMNGQEFFVGIGVDISTRKKAEAQLMELNRTLEEKVEQRTMELKSANADLANANEELIAMNEQMQAINEELANTNKQLLEMQAYLIETEKMAALGSLVAGVAHEVNTPLGVSVTAASHLSDIAQELMALRQEKEMHGEDFVPFLQDIEMASGIILKNLNRASQLIQSFKQLSVDQSLEPQRRFDVSEYLDEVLLSLSPLVKKTNITIRTHCDEKLIIDGWPGAFAQIVTNLVLNAVQHAFLPGEEGNIDIHLSSKRNRIALLFKDDGHGMPKDILERIYEPFFTTRRSSGGTGLGLSVVYTIVTQRYHGSIRCESAPGQGTAFHIELVQGGNLNG